MQEVFFFFDARKETPLPFSFSRLTDGCLSLCVSTLASCALRSRADKDCIFQEAGCEFFFGAGFLVKGFVVKGSWMDKCRGVCWSGVVRAARRSTGDLPAFEEGL